MLHFPVNTITLTCTYAAYVQVKVSICTGKVIIFTAKVIIFIGKIISTGKSKHMYR